MDSRPALRPNHKLRSPVIAGASFRTLLAVPRRTTHSLNLPTAAGVYRRRWICKRSRRRYQSALMATGGFSGRGVSSAFRFSQEGAER